MFLSEKSPAKKGTRLYLLRFQRGFGQAKEQFKDVP
jgi:hypothetical protein